MKKTFSYLLVTIAIASIISSCASMKRDCQGKRHYRQPNGVYL